MKWVKWLAGLLVVGCVVAMLVLFVYYHTPWGVALRGWPTPAVSLKEFKELIELEKTLFPGYSPARGNWHGLKRHYPQYPRAQGLSWGSTQFWTLKADAPTGDPTDELERIARQLAREAAIRGFYLPSHGFRFRSFGKGEGDWGTISHSRRYEGAPGSSVKRGGGRTTGGGGRFAYLRMQFISVDNLASQFCWTVILDRKTRDIEMDTHYWTAGPLYKIGPDTPVSLMRLKDFQIETEP
ncbi:MAG: hypothetical protein ACYS5V_01080 [Planctomycetota bacterium]|jgi:hypothetical protein